MKIGFKKGSKFYSPLIRTFTTSNYSHAAILIGSRLYESAALKRSRNKSGVRDYEITPEIEAEYEWFDSCVPDELALTRYEEIKHCKYDYFSLLSFVSLKVRDRKRYYCYELVLYMMTGAVHERVTPEVLLCWESRLRSKNYAGY